MRAMACFVLVLAAASTASAQELSADDVRARTHFEAGRSYFEEGAYDRARDEFQRAYDLSRRPQLLLNLATTHERLGDYQRAIEAIREYLNRTPDDPSRATLERRIQNLERLERERASGVVSTTTEPPERTPGGAGGMDGGLLAGTIAGYGVAGVGLVLMGVFGGMALSEDSALREGCGATASCTPAQVADADTFALVSDIGLGLAIAGAAAGTILLVLGLTSSSSSERALVAPWLTPEGGGVATRVSF